MEVDEGVHAKMNEEFEKALPEISSHRPWRELDQIEKDEADGSLSYKFVTNDGTDESLIELVNCKCLFGRQLPKMPKEYIVRLVFDRRHLCLMMTKKEVVSVASLDSASSPSGSATSKQSKSKQPKQATFPEPDHQPMPLTPRSRDVVVAAVCFRPFGTFCEIAFLAVSSKEQVKGYGTRLMNHLKEALKIYGVTDLVTYADNAAVGYFTKQGFYSPTASQATKADSEWHRCIKAGYDSYIKDYDGANKMVCCIYKDVNYLTLSSMREEAKASIWRAYLKLRNPEKFKGLETFPPKVYQIPGLEFLAPPSQARGESASSTGSPVDRQRPFSSRLQVPSSVEAMVNDVLETALSNGSSWPFREPVDVSLAPDYYQVVRSPIDISAMKSKNARKEYKSLEQLREDFALMFENCLFYNGEDSVYATAAEVLKKLVHQRIDRLTHLHR